MLKQATLADKAALQTAVDACIVEDATGACPSYEPIGLWDLSQLTTIPNNIDYLFQDKMQFNQDLSGWNVKKVTNTKSQKDGL